MGGLHSDVGVGCGCFPLNYAQIKGKNVYDEALGPEFALLPLHRMFGNESEYDLMLEMSGDQLSALVGAVFQLCG